MLQLSAPGMSTTSSAKARETIKHLVGNVVNRPADGNPKGWAQRVIDRADSGQKVTPTMLSMAREALAGEN
jgi:hypothetical protein